MNLLELRVFWGKVLLRVDHVRYPWRITVGQGRGVDIFVASDDLPNDSYELVRTDAERCVLAVALGMNGEIERRGEVQPLTGTEYVLDAGDRSIVCWGGLTFALRFVSAEAAAPRFAWRDVDHEFLRPLAVSLCGHLAAIVTLLMMPYATDSLREDFHELIEITRLLPPPSMPKPVAQNPSESPQKQPAVSTVARRTQPTHAVGRSRSFADRMHDMLDPHTFIGGGGSLSGHLRDIVIGARYPSGASVLGGIGPRGPFGGGPFASSRDVGLPDGGARPAAREHELGRQREHGFITPQAPDVADALPREVIRAVVDRNRAQIRYCYERELQKHQELEGRIVMRWIVAATGAVVRVEVSDTTLANRQVADCLSSQIARWRFPEPAGGGVVTVSYPFVFRAN